MTAEDRAPRAGRVAIVGRPNVGKSTLLNALLGQKLAIATPRPGTTRSNILGVYTKPDPPTQIAFVDTPGMGHSRTALHRLLVELARASLADTDAVVLVTDRAAGDGDVFAGDLAVLDAVRMANVPIVLAVNKVDAIRPKEKLLPLLSAWEQAHDFAAIVPMSATEGDNLDALVGELRKLLPEGLLYDQEFLTDRPERFFVAELVREAVMLHTRDEVPYGVAVLLDEYLDEEQVTRITATIVVEKESHKGIVIGKRGGLLKTIGTEARKEIERLIGRKVFLKLWVKVIPGWTAQPGRVRELAGGGME